MDEYGIPKDHILYSRNASFAEENKEVDVILDSLSGESLVASWEFIALVSRLDLFTVSVLVERFHSAEDTSK